MNDELSRLSQTVSQHDRDIQAMQANTNRMLLGQEKVVESLNNLAMSLQRYTDKHDRVEDELVTLRDDVRELRDMQHTNQPLIDGIRAIHGKLLLVVVSAFASPAAILAMLMANSGAGK